MPPQTVEIFITEIFLTALNIRLRALGGFILVTGGTVTLTGCKFDGVLRFANP